MKALALLTAAALSLLSVAAPHKPTRTAKAKLRRRRRLLPKASAGDWGDRPLCRSLFFWARMSAIGGKADYRRDMSGDKPRRAFHRC